MPPPPPIKKDAAPPAGGNDLGKTFHPGEPLPKPQVVEKDSDTAWAMFQALQDGAPAENYATTARDSLDAPSPRPDTRGLKPLSMDEVMFEARRNNRVCPMPSHWQRLFDLLKQAGPGLPPPVGVTEWRGTSSLNKRLILRNQVQWAWENGALEAMFAFLRELPEEKWHHMGD